MLEHDVGTLLLRRGYTLATAESLTGGLVGARVTSVAGSSEYYLGGIISYATKVKHSLLGVSNEVLRSLGPVSEEAAAEMAVGAKALLGATIGLSTTGEAGPEPQSGQSVGTLCIAVSDPSGVFTQKLRGPDSDRASIREWATNKALDFLISRLELAPEEPV